jgi:phosphatidylserine/phosphatidylglycerophosphate/cardiolipin synthase-like enzyme
MIAFINSATKTLLIENGQMNDASTVSALEAACQRGVQTRIVMTNFSQYSTQLAALTAAGCQVYLYPNTTSALYIHAKAAVADYGLLTQNAFISSINYTYSSLVANRELGVYITEPASVKLLYTTMSSDYAGSGVVVPAPLASFSSSSISFPDTMASRTSAVQNLTLTNKGSLPLTITKIALGGSNPSFFTQTSTCGASLAVSASCTLSITFKPTSAKSYSAYLLVSGNAPGSPQTIPLTGTGLAKAPLATLSTSSINFQLTTVGKTNSATGVTLTNTGLAPLDLSSITLTGANAAQFALASTCRSSLAVDASCSLSATFKPAAAAAYTAAISIASNAATSPQTITLTGTGTTHTISRSFYVFPESDATITPLYALVNNAQKSIDMTMWGLQDTIFLDDLVAACNRGVTVRVVLDQENEKSPNTPAFNQLNEVTNCSAVWGNPAFAVMHAKFILIDGSQVAVLSLNLQTKCYSSTRDFALVENDPLDIAAIQATFDKDYAAGVTAAGVTGTSDFKYVPGLGDANDLIWSPTNARPEMLSFINNATKSLLIENEELLAPDINSAIEAACMRGVQTDIAFTDFSQFSAQFAALKAAGCNLYLYPYKGEYSGKGFYIHTKAAVADYGLPTQKAFMGSISYSTYALIYNRELNIYITDQSIVDTLYQTMLSDFEGNGTVVQ